MPRAPIGGIDIAWERSGEGQRLLFDPKISRLPVLPALYAKAPAGYPNPFSGKIKPKVSFETAQHDAAETKEPADARVA